MYGWSSTTSLMTLRAEVDVLPHRLADLVAGVRVHVLGDADLGRSAGTRNWPPKGAMIRPAFTMVGPGTSPCSTAWRSAVSA